MTRTFDTSPQTLPYIAERYPENLVFFPLEVLTRGLARRGARVKAAVIAELFVRFYMAGDSHLTDIINRHLPDGEALDFSGLLSYRHREISEPEALNRELWKPRHGLSRLCRDAVRYRFQRLFMVDGLIPFFLKDDNERSFLLPFSFEDKGRAGVYDLGGKEIPEWTRHVDELGLETVVRIHCHCLDDLPFGGASMMLPVQMAWWRSKDKDERLLPYHPFSIVATGEFDRDGLLLPVSLKGKPDAVKTQLWKAAFVFPQNDEALPDGLQCLKLPPAITKEEVKQRIRQFVEQRTNWDKDYAIRRLKELAQEVRKWNVSHWKELIDSLERASEAFNEYENPENCLLNMMFQSEAHCHCGNTARAKEINQEALEFAEEHDRKKGDHSFLYFILRLEIEQLVLHQDDEEFELIASPSAQLEQKLASFEASSEDKSLPNDLWMRYNGTMGQIHLCASLLGLDGYSRQKAKEYFEKAVHHAMATEDDADMAQDFNYMVLYHAVFESGTKHEARAVKAARSKIAELNKKKDKAYQRNLCFFLRYVALSLYRQVLQGENPECPDLFEFERLCQNGGDGVEGWLLATICKYIGAVLAANGDREKAEKWFETALSAIDDSAWGIILFIKMTVCAEAYRSLCKDAYLQKARMLLERISASMPAYGSLPAWRNYIENPLNEFPGLKYWY